MRPGEDRGAWKECLALLPPGPDAFHPLPPPRRDDRSGRPTSVRLGKRRYAWYFEAAALHLLGGLMRRISTAVVVTFALLMLGSSTAGAGNGPSAHKYKDVCAKTNGP